MVRKAPDYWMLLSVLLLLGVGILMIFSATPYVAFQQYQDSFYYIRRHLSSLGLGFFGFLFGFSLDYRFFRKYIPHFLASSFFLLLLTFIPGIGVSLGGASRWLQIGGISFQPSELIKLAVIFFVAQAITVKKEKMQDLVMGFFPIILVVGIIALCVLAQPDLGTSLVILCTTLLMVFVGGSSFWSIFIFSLLGLRVLAWVASRTPYQRARLIAFVDPWQDSQGLGFHIIQSLLAVGSGGFFGLGLGHSKQKFAYLPQQFTDFIFAILCEEGGFVIASMVIFIFLFFIFRGFRIALKAPDRFGQILAAGIVTCLGLQVLLNISVVLGLLPTTGIPLVFISHGGTAMVVNLFAVGILANISSFYVLEEAADNPRENTY
ncbi:MAG: putative lipid II flippase FtsW [Candidatus Margulisbacteria bacterium]|nr:putative lipid II flippase FtsW [Candidatus Margulisiibacteriota bacterium]